MLMAEHNQDTEYLLNNCCEFSDPLGCCTEGGDGGGIFTGNQSQIYLSKNPTNIDTTLFVIWIGANDLEAGTEVNQTVSNIGDLITLLFSHGAKYFLVNNLPNLLSTPLFRAIVADLPGCAVEITELLEDFDYCLNLMVTEVSAGSTEIQIYYGNTYALSNDTAFLIANGITNETARSVFLTDPYNYTSPRYVAPNITGNLWWDDQHPSTLGHQAIAKYIAENTFHITDPILEPTPAPTPAPTPKSTPAPTPKSTTKVSSAILSNISRIIILIICCFFLI